jgi:hypothetical protein
MATPARSPRAGSASRRWISATRPRSCTTTTVSCSTTPSNVATPPTHLAPTDLERALTYQSAGIALIVIILVVPGTLYGLGLLLSFVMRRGRNWARILLTIASAAFLIYTVISIDGIATFMSSGAIGVAFGPTSIAQLPLLIGTLWQLFRPTANRYFSPVQRGRNPAQLARDLSFAHEGRRSPVGSRPTTISTVPDKTASARYSFESYALSASSRPAPVRSAAASRQWGVPQGELSGLP